jgi:hypothetical protein
VRAGLCLLATSLGLWAVVAGLGEPLGPWEAATLVATAMLISLCAARLVVVPLVAGPIDALAQAAGAVPLAPIGLCDPDAPGRPRPRAPGRATAARSS